MAFKDDEDRRAYFREYNKGWYQRHREKILEKRKRRHQEIIEWFRRYKSTLYCMDCGENHPACLHFHHRKDEDKKFTIASVVSRANSLRQITNEIKKCDVLCANCHAIHHWRETHEFDDWTEVFKYRNSQTNETYRYPRRNYALQGQRTQDGTPA